VLIKPQVKIAGRETLPAGSGSYSMQAMSNLDEQMTESDLVNKK
jgi:hypothetical protein